MNKFLALIGGPTIYYSNEWERLTKELLGENKTPMTLLLSDLHS